MKDWHYTVLKPAERYLKRIQPKSRQRIFEELDKLLRAPTQVDFKKLKGCSGYRLRVGDYRVLIESAIALNFILDFVRHQIYSFFFVKKFSELG